MFLRIAYAVEVGLQPQQLPGDVPGDASRPQATIIVLGDSLSAGYGIALQKAWPSLLQERLLLAGYPLQVVNASVSGETTKGGLSRVGKLLKNHQPQLVLIELGANDGLRGVPANHAKNNLQGIIDKVINAGAEVLLFEMIVPPNYGEKFTQLYTKMYEDVAKLPNVNLVPFFLQGVVFAPGMMQEDGLHPTEKAQPVLLDHVWPYVEDTIQKIAGKEHAGCEEDQGLAAVLEIAGIECDEVGELDEILQ